MAMRTLIVDNEATAGERLKRYLANLEEVEVIGEAKDGVQAVEMIEAQSPEQVLLDIQMPGLDGFGVVEALEDPPAIIFVTAYDQYAIRAFEIHALDYLLKPFSRSAWRKPSTAPGRPSPRGRISAHNSAHSYRAWPPRDGT